MKLVIFPVNSDTIIFTMTEYDIRVFENWYNSVGAKMFNTDFKIYSETEEGYTKFKRSDISYYKTAK